LWRSWIEVEPTEEVRETARRLLRAHPLRAADALQLAAAFIAAEGRPPTLAFVTLDDRLRTAAAREGFAPADL
jgi:predicted nucleic acid-binding protein